jgi:hypothetical protein
MRLLSALVLGQAATAVVTDRWAVEPPRSGVAAAAAEEAAAGHPVLTHANRRRRLEQRVGVLAECYEMVGESAVELGIAGRYYAMHSAAQCTNISVWQQDGAWGEEGAGAGEHFLYAPSAFDGMDMAFQGVWAIGGADGKDMCALGPDTNLAYNYKQSGAAPDEAGPHWATKIGEGTRFLRCADAPGGKPFHSFCADRSFRVAKCSKDAL